MPSIPRLALLRLLLFSYLGTSVAHVSVLISSLLSASSRSCPCLGLALVLVVLVGYARDGLRWSWWWGSDSQSLGPRGLFFGTVARLVHPRPDSSSARPARVCLPFARDIAVLDPLSSARPYLLRLGVARVSVLPVSRFCSRPCCTRGRTQMVLVVGSTLPVPNAPRVVLW